MFLLAVEFNGSQMMKKYLNKEEKEQREKILNVKQNYRVEDLEKANAPKI